MSDRPLPWQPEPLASLRARYPEAVAEIVDVESVQVGAVLRPGQQRRHVLDHPDGIRLIVSRDRLPDGRICTHLSASLDAAHCAPALRGRMGAHASRILQILQWHHEVLRAYSEASGRAGVSLLHVGRTPGGVSHWEVLE